MELWIRTQDKKQLLKVNDGLYIANCFTDTNDTFIGIKNVGHVGRYAEEERAIEVLDELEKLLSGVKAKNELSKANLSMNNLYPILIYKMPKE